MRKRQITLKPKLPKLRSDRPAELLIQKADLTRYDLSSMRALRFEFSPKQGRVKMRIPDGLLKAVNAAAGVLVFPIRDISDKRWSTRPAEPEWVRFRSVPRQF